VAGRTGKRNYGEKSIIQSPHNFTMTWNRQNSRCIIFVGRPNLAFSRATMWCKPHAARFYLRLVVCWGWLNFHRSTTTATRQFGTMLGANWPTSHLLVSRPVPLTASKLAWPHRRACRHAASFAASQRQQTHKGSTTMNERTNERTNGER